MVLSHLEIKIQVCLWEIHKKAELAAHFADAQV
jgi:hypothetical protein